MCLSAEWRVLEEHFNSLCINVPHNHQFIIDKLKLIPQLVQDGGEQLSKLMSSSADDRKINERIITYLVITLCYNGSDTDLVRLCDVMKKLIDPSDTPTSIQQIRCGMYIYSV